MTRTGFDPSVHGFRFSNRFVNVTQLMDTRGLCGGMSLAAARFWRHRRRIPSQPWMPRAGTPLQRYIFRCQMESYGPFGLLSAVNWYVHPWISFDDQFGWCAGEFDRLRPRINRNEPVVIGLRGREWGNLDGHQVLAIGYDTAPNRVFVYDPNYPGERSLISLDQATRRLVYSHDNGGPANNNLWSSFFMTGCDLGDQPPPEMADEM